MTSVIPANFIKIYSNDDFSIRSESDNGNDCTSAWMNTQPTCPTFQNPLEVSSMFSLKERVMTDLNHIKNDVYKGPFVGIALVCLGIVAALGEEVGTISAGKLVEAAEGIGGAEVLGGIGAIAMAGAAVGAGATVVSSLLVGGAVLGVTRAVGANEKNLLAEAVGTMAIGVMAGAASGVGVGAVVAGVAGVGAAVGSIGIGISAINGFTIRRGLTNY